MGWSHQLESNCCKLQLSELSSPNGLTHHSAKFSESFEFRKGSWMFWIRKREARWVLRRKKERNWFRNCFFDSKINFLLPQFLYSVEADRHLQKTSQSNRLIPTVDSNGLRQPNWSRKRVVRYACYPTATFSCRQNARQSSNLTAKLSIVLSIVLPIVLRIVHRHTPTFGVFIFAFQCQMHLN